MINNFIKRLNNIEEMEEVDIYLYIESLNYLIKNSGHEIFKEYQKRIILQLTKFGITIENDSFTNWYNFYKEYFDGLSKEEFYDFIYLYNNNLDASMYYPKVKSKKIMQ